MNPSMRDANLVSTIALLPSGAATVVGTAVNLGTSSAAGEFSVQASGQFLAQCEFLVEAPALTTTELPDTKTVTYDIISSANSDMSSPTVVCAGALVQTGAGGVGAAAATRRFRPSTDAQQYWALRATGISGTAANDIGATMSLVF